jgi:hypothetical protein
MSAIIYAIPTAVALLFVNEFAPRAFAAREGDVFRRFALKEVRPFAYALSGGFFVVTAIMEPGNTVAMAASLFIVLAIYVVARRVYQRAR